jgi:hypothetical protein
MYVRARVAPLARVILKAKRLTARSRFGRDSLGVI